MMLYNCFKNMCFVWINIVFLYFYIYIFFISYLKHQTVSIADNEIRMIKVRTNQFLIEKKPQ